MTLNNHSTLPIICLLFALISGIFVYIKNPREKLNQIFFFICVNIAGWLSFYIPFNLTLSENALLWWFKISYCFISFLPIMCFTFVTTYIDIPRNKFWYRINCFLGITLSLLSIFTPFIINGVIHLNIDNYPYPRAGVLHPLLVIHCFCLSLYSLKLIASKLKEKDLPPKRNNQLKYIFTAILALSTGMTDFTSNYGITWVYPIGCLSTTIFLFILSACILRHQLMNINVVLKKGLIYSSLISIITIVYLSVVLIIERFFHNYLGYHSITASLVTAILIALIFIPLKNKIQNILDRSFFKGSQSEIAAQNEQLRQEIAQTERLKSVAILASGIAHEIKNPLTPLKTFSEHLPERINDVDFLKKFSPIIAHEVTRIDKLVHELLDFAKPSPIILTPTPVHKILNDTIDFLTNNCIKQRINVTKDFNAHNACMLDLDANQFRQALINILLNAIDAMPHGGELTVSSVLLHQAQILQIRFSDTGCGIDPKDTPHIFDPFFTKKDQGTGLGLSITHEIIKNHQGKIFVESKKDRGTTFIIELPVK